MNDLLQQVFAASVSGVIGGTITGVAAFAAIRVELRYMRRDLDNHHERLTILERS